MVDVLRKLMTVLVVLGFVSGTQGLRKSTVSRGGEN